MSPPSSPSSKPGKGAKPAKSTQPGKGSKQGKSAHRGSSPQAGKSSPSAPRQVTVGVLEKRGRFLVAVPLFERGAQIAVDGGRNARAGDLVLVRIAGRSRTRGKIEQRIGRPDNARDVIEALMLERGLTRGFDPAVQRIAAEVAVEPPGGGRDQARGDLRDLPTFTIDPETAKDFDDALSVTRITDDTWRVYVHIADVAAHVRPATPIDREARRRATSVYVPGAVEPMLPHALSSDACSLLPGCERLAVTVEMEFEIPEGGAGMPVVTRATFSRSTIRSDVRLTYEQVDRIFAGKEVAEKPWAQPLIAAREVAAALERARESRGALAIESSELEFAFDKAGHVTRAERAIQTESHRLVEHLMIAANEQVALLLSQRKVATLYRVHERSDPVAVKRLVEQLASLGVATPPIPEHLAPAQAGKLVAEISRSVDVHVKRVGHGRAALTSLVLRSLKQAHYSPTNRGHAGLGSSHYCHFTSPIRRYPDLICHRALLSAVGEGEEAPRVGEMEAEGIWASERERESMRVERDADDIARCFLLQRQLFKNGVDQVFEGEVVGLAPIGAFVAFGEGYEGLLPVRKMRGEWWELNELATVLSGTRSGATIALGDPVSVKVERVDAPRGRVDLLPVEA
ncbi:MAG: RNB domain-containing ribonuclease [Actinomycetota bacterium]